MTPYIEIKESCHYYYGFLYNYCYEVWIIIKTLIVQWFIVYGN